ncbi:MAG TPA: phosphoglycerate transporter [Oryzihumus sp.]|nr:phosphoglycerate transporter [Oryzihumus sp.]
MPQELDSAGALARTVLALDLPEGRAPVVGVSGFGGSGKSTLAAQLHAHLPGSTVVPGDEFLRSRPPVGRSEDWDSVDRDRLAEQVLEPARRGEAQAYQVWDHDTGAPGPWVSLAGATAVIVEGLGLYVPALVGLFDLRVWVDVDLDTATARGMWRDEHEYGNAQADLWAGVWRPNDADFFARHRPDRAAHVLYAPSPTTGPASRGMVSR